LKLQSTLQLQVALAYPSIFAVESVTLTGAVDVAKADARIKTNKPNGARARACHLPKSFSKSFY
jgi:hypothetical protein